MRRSVVLAAVLLAACGGSNKNFSLSARARTQSSGGTTAPAASGIALTRVRIALRELELRSRNNDVRTEIEVGPLVLDFRDADLNGRLHPVLDAKVPAGTYDKIEFKIEPLEKPIAAPEAADLVNERASVIIEGKIGSETFTFVSRIEAEEEIEGKFTVSGTSSNVTLDVDTSGWFTKNGAQLDPRDPANRAAIEDNLRNSITAFDDDDRDGHEDDDDHEDDGEHGDGGHADGGHGDGGHDGGDH